MKKRKKSRTAHKKDKNTYLEKIAEEMKKLGRETRGETIKWLHSIICKVWDREAVLEDLRKEMKIPIHKKVKRKECNNSRAIELLGVPRELFTRSILNRMKESIDKVFRENQYSFREGRRCTNQIFIICQKTEKRV